MSNIERRSSGKAMDPWKDLFDMNFFGTSFPQVKHTMPAVNLSEDDKNYCVDVVAPGFKKEDFKIRVHDDVLTISAETQTERTEGGEGKGKEYSRREYSCNSFTRSFQLPDNVKDYGIEAKYNEGILQIDIPKIDKQTKSSKEISIQ